MRIERRARWRGEVRWNGREEHEDHFGGLGSSFADPRAVVVVRMRTVRFCLDVPVRRSYLQARQLHALWFRVDEEC